MAALMMSEKKPKKVIVSFSSRLEFRFLSLSVRDLNGIKLEILCSLLEKVNY